MGYPRSWNWWCHYLSHYSLSIGPLFRGSRVICSLLLDWSNSTRRKSHCSVIVMNEIWLLLSQTTHFAWPHNKQAQGTRNLIIHYNLQYYLITVMIAWSSNVSMCHGNPIISTFYYIKKKTWLVLGQECRLKRDYFMNL